MNFYQLQLVEYGLNMFSEFSTGYEKSYKISLTIKSDTDIFKATSLTEDDKYDYFDKNLVENIQTSHFKQNDLNPFWIIRKHVYEAFFADGFKKSMSHKGFLKCPEAFVKPIIEYVQTIDINHEFDMPTIFRNYQSLKYEKLAFDRYLENSNSYEIVSISITD